MYPTEKLAFGSLLYVQNDLSFCVLSRPPMKIRLSIGGRNLRLADEFLIGWFPSPSISAYFSVLAGKIFAMDVIRNQTSAEIIFWPLWQTPREYLNLQLISPRMLRLHFVINYGISEHLWTPHRLDKYSSFMTKERTASCARNTYITGNRWRNMTARLRTDRDCETLWYIYNDRKIGFILQKQRKGKKWPIGGRLWILF